MLGTIQFVGELFVVIPDHLLLNDQIMHACVDRYTLNSQSRTPNPKP